MTGAGDAGPGAVDPVEYERRCSFDQVALDTARTMDAVFKSLPLYLRVTKAQITITDLLMRETASLAAELAAARANVEAPWTDAQVEAACRAAPVMSNPLADPDKLMPMPRGQVGRMPLWRICERVIRPALDAARAARTSGAPDA